MTHSSDLPIVMGGVTTSAGNKTDFFNSNLPHEMRMWYSDSADKQTFILLFGRQVMLDSFSIYEIGSDMTTDDFEWDAHRILPSADFSFYPITGGKNVNVRRGGKSVGAMGFSSDNVGQSSYRELKPGFTYCRNVQDEHKVTLVEPLIAVGIRLRILSGYGWFSAGGMRAGGTVMQESGLEDYLPYMHLVEAMPVVYMPPR